MAIQSQAQRVQNRFAQGKLVAPAASQANFVDLARALLVLAGAGGHSPAENVEDLCRRIGSAEHYVFVLFDGLGYDQLHAILPTGTFLRQHTTARLHAVFPSTTACALTTLATGQWPGQHGITGWWTYLPDRDICAVTLPFTDRATGQSLQAQGISLEEVLPIPSRWSDLARRPLSILPEPVSGSIYSLYASGGTPTRGYVDLPDALALVRHEVQRASQPSFIYLYLPQYDSVVHHQGTDSKEAFGLVRQLDRWLGDLRAELPENTRLIVSADHGLVDTPPGKTHKLAPTDPLVARLRTWPSGERTNPIFHVLPGQETAFFSEFTDRFGEDFALVTAAEAESLSLFGPEPLTPLTRQRVGTYLGVGLHAAQLYVDPGNPDQHRLVGVHGGLSLGEMLVPLIVA